MTYPLDTTHNAGDPTILHEGDHYSIHVNEKRSILDYLTTPTDTRDSTIDRTALFQAAVDSIPQSGSHNGGAIYVPAGSWRLNSTVNIYKRGLRLYSDSGGINSVDDVPGYGCSIIVAAGITGFQFDPGATTLDHWGPTLQGLNFIESGGYASAKTSTLVRMRNTNHATIRDCSFRFADMGLKLDHNVLGDPGMDSAWHNIDGCKFFQCDIGTYIGGMAYMRATTFLDCQVWAIEMDGFAAQGHYDFKIDGGGHGGVWCKGNNNHFIGCRQEGSNPSYRFGGDNAQGFFGDRNTVIGGNVTLNNTAHVAFDILAEAAGTVISDVTPWGNVTNTNWIVDAGAHTVVRGSYNGILDGEAIAWPSGNTVPTVNPPSGGLLHVPSGDTTQLKWRTSGGLLYDLARVMSGTGSPEGVVTAPVGTLFCRTDGGAGTTLYVKQSGAGNTGWAAK